MLRRNTSDGGGDARREKPDGIVRWLTTVDNQDIGTLYIVFGVLTGVWGGIDALMFRTSLLTPKAGIWGREMYNALFTTHGLTMLFLFAMPVLFGVANYFIPLLVESNDMAFPRVNAVAFWVLPPALLLMRAGLLTSFIGIEAIEPPKTGWTLYVPLSAEQPNPDVDLVLLGLHLSGLSTIMGGINFVVTIIAQRSSDVDWADLDIFSWTMLTTGGLIIFAFPVLGSALVMLLLDRNFGTTFFTVEGGGPLLWQHLFWFFGHPEVYILVLPPMGLISYILPKFAGRKLFGFKFIVYSTLAIGVLSFGVWAHHMFATGIDPRLRASFMAVTLAIAVPSAVKTFNWMATLWNGRIRLTTPMLFCVGAIVNFIIGGVTGVFLAAVPVDLLLHDTYYVVGHFHLILVGMILFAMFAANYYWFPVMTGRMYNEQLGKIHFWLTIVGVIITFNSLLFLGQSGLPRRMAVYPDQFAPLQQIITVGAYLIGFGQLFWIWNMLRSVRIGRKIENADVWDLRANDAFTREWEWLENRLEEHTGTDDDD
ncbi:cbb3-type cytochrome c oxidase subunit I [Haladaptatus halobius]|uniref:cbb3-type cytochrome c oxidase subunit I n=1 Tax=Haladaptatus halobius TaxID=2884875 RepID=UPI001D0A90BC|nr:cbb3-type cytochrome c oxidase subunit I [Haladaptatus halobius]